MSVTLTDQQIEALVQEAKNLPTDWQRRMQLALKRGHEERHLDVTGADGSEFRVILRQGTINVLDFSIILAVRVPQSTQFFRLRRYNGRSHEHTNRIEGESFYDFHIHFATERYQELGAREDGYAKPTARYEALDGAVRCLLDDARFELQDKRQGDLFEE